MDEGWPTTKRFHRNLQSAFGPHTSRHLDVPQEPLFATSVWASRAIGIALTVACAVVAWLLATGR